MSEWWLTVSLYNSLSTHLGSANSFPHDSQKVCEIRLSEYSTQSPNKTHRPSASRSETGEGGELCFPAQEKGPESEEDTESASLTLPWPKRDIGRLCLEKHTRTFSLQAALTHHSYLTRHWQHLELIRTQSNITERFHHADITFSTWHCT